MSARVYVGRISHRARDKDVERLFRNFGRIREIVLKNGYGFVEFEDQRDADDAVHELSGKDLCGERIIVERARGTARGRGRFGDGDRGGGYDRGGSDRGQHNSSSRAPGWLDKKPDSRYGPPTRTEYRLIVENLSSRVSWQDLKDYMRQAGEVTYADAHKDQKNEGVVEFASYSDMKTALDKLDDTEINGRRIKLVEDKPKRRSGSRSRSRSRSKSRSRSRSRSARRSRSKSRSRSASKSKSRSRSASAEPPKKPRVKSQSRSKSRSRSRSPVKEEVARPVKAASPARSSSSRSASPVEDQNGGDTAVNDEEMHP